MNRRIWNRQELLLAFNLYCKIPFSKIHFSHPEIVELSKLIDRSPSAVALKLVNFARLDPELSKRNISGMSHGSKADIEIWNEFHDDWELLAYESEKQLEIIKGANLSNTINESDIVGKEKESITRVRVNQNFFRSTVLASYNFKCCITGLDVKEFLIASHIIPWSVDKKNRLNPRNGLCLNSLHDQAFDRGLLTITPNFKVKISPRLADIGKSKEIDRQFLKYNNKKIKLPHRFLPNTDFLEYHNEEIFID